MSTSINLGTFAIEEDFWNSTKNIECQATEIYQNGQLVQDIDLANVRPANIAFTSDNQAYSKITIEDDYLVIDGSKWIAQGPDGRKTYSQLGKAFMFVVPQDQLSSIKSVTLEFFDEEDNLILYNSFNYSDREDYIQRAYSLTIDSQDYYALWLSISIPEKYKGELLLNCKIDVTSSNGMQIKYLGTKQVILLLPGAVLRTTKSSLKSQEVVSSIPSTSVELPPSVKKSATINVGITQISFGEKVYRLRDQAVYDLLGTNKSGNIDQPTIDSEIIDGSEYNTIKF